MVKKIVKYLESDKIAKMEIVMILYVMMREHLKRIQKFLLMENIKRIPTKNYPEGNLMICKMAY